MTHQAVNIQSRGLAHVINWRACACCEDLDTEWLSSSESLPTFTRTYRLHVQDERVSQTRCVSEAGSKQGHGTTQCHIPENISCRSYRSEHSNPTCRTFSGTLNYATFQKLDLLLSSGVKGKDFTQLCPSVRLGHFVGDKSRGLAQR
jgi:hypothetical protein